MQLYVKYTCTHNRIKLNIYDTGTTYQVKISPQLPTGVLVPSIVLPTILFIALVVAIIFFTTKHMQSKAKVKTLQAQVTELSTIYEEVDSRPQEMEENIAYNTVTQSKE